MLDAKERVKSAGLAFEPLGISDCPVGTVSQLQAELGRLTGLAAVRYTLWRFREFASVIMRDGPGVLQRLSVDGAVVDQAYSPAGSVASAIGVPFVSICNALLLNQERDIPPPVAPWTYQTGGWARLRNRILYALAEWTIRGYLEDIRVFRRRHGLPVLSRIDDHFSQLAQISQSPVEFEFPRHRLPDCFHFTGPFHSTDDRPKVEFDFGVLDNRPLIYASMGTLQNRVPKVFQTIATACAALEVKLVISLGGGGVKLGPLPGNPTVVDYAPQLELLSRSSLVITHAGMNTTLESLSQGIPLVAIPVTNDQPGVAGRVLHHGLGQVVTLSHLSATRLRMAI